MKKKLTITEEDYALNEPFNTITVMDYCLNEIRVYRNVYTEDPKEWLQEHDGNWKEDQCYYMYGHNTEVNEYEQ